MLNFIDILYFLLVKTYYNFILTFSASLYILPVYIVFAYIYSTLITPAPVWANMIQTLVHTCRGLGCSIFIETNVKRQSNPLPFKVCSIQQCTEHIQPSTIISKNYSKKCVHFGTTARVIRVLICICIRILYYGQYNADI